MMPISIVSISAPLAAEPARDRRPPRSRTAGPRTGRSDEVLVVVGAGACIGLGATLGVALGAPLAKGAMLGPASAIGPCAAAVRGMTGATSTRLAARSMHLTSVGRPTGPG